MRVGLLIYGSLENTSGGYLYDRMLVEHLRQQGDQVEIISLPWRNYARHLGDNFSAQLWHRLRELKVDILLQDELNHPSLFWINRKLNSRVGYPVISIVHHLRSSEARPAWKNLFYSLVEHRYLASVGGFVYNSQTTRRAVGSALSADPTGIVAYPAGDHLAPVITEGEILARSLRPGPLRILFVGNLIPRKGLHALLGALDNLSSQSWMLEVIGDPSVDKSYTRMILRLIDKNYLGENVTLHGQVSIERLKKHLRASQVLAVPSSYEGFGIVYLEAMGFGLPCIATTAGATAEIITHARDGYLVQSGNLQRLAVYLARLSEDRQLLARMGLAARRRFLGHPTWAQTCETIRDFLLSWLR